MSDMNQLQQQLKDLKPTKEFFIGIDSDGCVFDTMEIKQKECFCPNFIKYFDLQKISKYARETWEFVNLYSKTRGINRFIALIEAVELLKNRPEVQEWKVELPDLSPLKEWVKKESKLGNPTLKTYAQQQNDPMIDKVLAWSLKVNEDVADMVHGMGPFPFAGKALVKIHDNADALVISQTPVEALEREWEESDIKKYVHVIAGQEFGTKTEHLALAAKGKYPDTKILMIGDAPGDLKAAQSNGVLFYPINPGHENASWKRLFEEGLDRFFAQNYEGQYQDSLIEEFNAYLPEKPTWKF